MKHSSELVKTERGFSTQQILATELDLIQTVNAGCDAVAPLHPGYKPADWLGEDQQRAIYHVLRTSDRITGLRGLAAPAKPRRYASWSPPARKPVLNRCSARRRRRQRMFSAKKDLRRDAAKFAATKPTLSDRRLVVLDEAGAVGIDDMKRLFEMARDARIVLSGDTGQHASVARGDALRILEQHSDFQSGQLTHIRRQRKAEYRKAVELAAQKRTVEAFAHLERMGAVAESSNDETSRLCRAVVCESIGAKSIRAAGRADVERNRGGDGKSPCRVENVRSAGGEEKEFQVFDSLSWTEAQKRDTRQYRPGMAIHFHRRTAGFAKDENVAVVAVENDALKVQRADGSENIFPLGQGSACLMWGRNGN